MARRSGFCTLAAAGFLGLFFLVNGCVTEEKTETSFAFEGDDMAKPGSSLESKIAMLERKVAALPERVDLRSQLAQLYFEAERYEEAIQAIEEAIEKDPENGKLYQILGDFYVYMNRFAEAERNYRLVIKYAKPGFTGPHLALGYVLAMQEKYSEAITQFRQVLKLHPTMPTALYYLGSCYDVVGKRQEALAYFQKCARIESPYQKKALQEIARLKLLQRAAPGGSETPSTASREAEAR